MKTIFIVVLFFMSIAVEGCGQDKRDIFILPRDFTGYIIILYDQGFKIEYTNIPVDSVVAYGGTSGAANKDLTGKNVVRFTKYFVGNKKQIGSVTNKLKRWIF